MGPGDLLLVIQMQDADIGATNAITYGDGASGRGSTDPRSTGLYEYVSAISAVAGGVVTIAGSGAGNGLVKSYDFSTTVTATHGFRTFQVIRVPQYSSATFAGGLTAAPWDGAAHVGGVLAIDVAGALNLNGQTISVDQLGFKGALGVAQLGGPDTGTDYVVASQRGNHGYKGEGIAGTPHFLYDPITANQVAATADGYPSGDAARGAPGTAGGGGTDSHPVGNDENSGGGGGSNGGQGGLGGNTWNGNQPLGGLGGASFPAAANRVVLGGGGGAGTRNNSSGFASSGGTGGGLVMIRAGSVSGAGTISANGGLGVTPLNDGGGGGGAGGSVVVSASAGPINGLTIRANGGNGTDAWPTGPTGIGAYHGPGGGGSGGLIVTSNALLPAQTAILGGAHGTTTPDKATYGSTDGAAGVILTTTPAAIPGFSSGGECLPALTVTKSTSTSKVTNTGAGTTATYSITVGNSANAAPATGVSISDALPPGFAYASTGTIGLNGGASPTAIVDPIPGAPNPAFGTFSIPASGSVVITLTVSIAASVVPGTYNNPARATYLDPTRTTVAGTAQAGYPGGGIEAVTVEAMTVGAPDMTLAKSHVDPFARGSTSIYGLVATNSGSAATFGAVAVTDTLPSGLIPTAASGAGWSCPAPAGQTVTCTRADALAAGSSYPTITVTVTVSASAPNSVTNQATVSGGGQTNISNDTASDPTNIVAGLPGLPDAGGPTDGAGGQGAATPQGVLGLWLVALAAVASIGAVMLAGFGRRRSGAHVSTQRVRRRPPTRRVRLGLGAFTVLFGVVLAFVSVSQIALPAATSRAALQGNSPSGGTELIGSKVVTVAPPGMTALETFHRATGPITPARLRVPSIGVNAPIGGVGLRRDGSMDVPDNLWTTSWLATGPRPGQAGKSVIAGHRGIGTPALFSHLENVRPGDKIFVSDAAGGELVYEVTRVESLDLSSTTQVAVFGPAADQQLVLVTCHGRYLNKSRTYDHRLVVFSRPFPMG